MRRWRVKLSPLTEVVMVDAVTVFDAAEAARAGRMAKEALVERVWDADDPYRFDDCPSRVVFDQPRAAVHFVGFVEQDQRWQNAVQVFGPPDFVHRVWDQRAQREVAHGSDLLVFAKYHDLPPSPFNFDDSNEPHDPANHERRK